MLTTELAILLLLLAACVAAIALKHLRMPFTVGLVLIGLAAGWLANQTPGLAILQQITLSHDLILFLFVPPLVFESALNMNSRLLSRNLAPVVMLAVPGLLLSTLIVGFLLDWLTPLDVSQALLFGAIISATDPVAVIALFKEFGVPNRLMILIEGESLFNDASAIVTFNIILAIVATGGFSATTIVQGFAQAGIVFAGGILVGTIVATGMALSLRWAEENAVLQGTVSGIVAYLAFIIAEHEFHVSGVIAVMTAGLIVGWLKSNRVKPEVRAFLGEFWEYVAFLANSLIFLLIGLSTATFLGVIERESYFASSIFWAIAVVILARAIVVYTLVPLVNRWSRSDPIDRSYQTISVWGGLRGAVALALALSLAPNFPNRDLIMVLTLAVALFTIIAGGLSMGQLLHALNLDRPTVLSRLEGVEALVKVKREGLQQIIKLESLPIFAESALIDLKQKYQQAVIDAETSIVSFWSELHPHPQQLRQALWTQALSIEKQLYQDFFDRGMISMMALDRLKQDINLRQDAIQAGIIPPPQMKLLSATPWEKLMVVFTSRLFPEDQGSRLESETERDLYSRYEYYAAISFVSTKVAQRVKSLAEAIASRADQLPEVKGIDTTLVEECAQTYEHYSSAALEKLESGVNYSPEIILSFQQKLALQATLASEEAAIAQIVKDGLISPTTGEQIRLRL